MKHNSNLATSLSGFRPDNGAQRIAAVYWPCCLLTSVAGVDRSTRTPCHHGCSAPTSIWTLGPVAGSRRKDFSSRGLLLPTPPGNTWSAENHDDGRLEPVRISSTKMAPDCAGLRTTKLLCTTSAVHRSAAEDLECAIDRSRMARVDAGTKSRGGGQFDLHAEPSVGVAYGEYWLPLSMMWVGKSDGWGGCGFKVKMDSACAGMTGFSCRVRLSRR